MGLRAEMPSIAAFVDQLRGAFGTALVNEWLRGRDAGWICARENGVRWCTPGRKCEECFEREQSI